MEQMFSIAGIVFSSEDLAGVIISVSGIIAGVILLPMMLRHKREMAKVHSGASDVETALAGPANANQKEIEDLRKRCDALEKRCESLEAQVTDAHMLLVDERRELDRKLASVLSDSAPAAASEKSREKLPAKTVM